MILRNIDRTYKVYKYDKYLVVESGPLCIVFYGNDIKKLKTILKRFK